MSVRDEWIEAVGDAILADITDRRGWRQEWDQFDDDIQEEIRITLGRIAADAYDAAALERGWKMTPRDVTPEMDDALTGYIPEEWETIWCPMWDAAPSPGDE